MLSDTDLAVTDAFGLRNQAFHTAPPGDKTEALPVPTTLLVDTEGGSTSVVNDCTAPQLVPIEFRARAQ